MEAEIMGSGRLYNNNNTATNTQTMNYRKSLDVGMERSDRNSVIYLLDQVILIDKPKQSVPK